MTRMTDNDPDMAIYGWDEGYDFAYKEISEYPIFQYFHENGDEIEGRVTERLQEAASKSSCEILLSVLSSEGRYYLK